MSEELEVKLDAELEEAKATGEDSMSADATTPAGGQDKKRKADKSTTGEKTDNVEDDVKTPQGGNDSGLKESVFGLFEGQDLSDEFKTKTVAVFEAAVHEKTTAIQEELEAKFAQDLEEQVAAKTEELIEKVDAYLDYVVEQWMEANEVAIESSIKVEVAESLLDSLKGLVVEHNLSIDDETRDVVAEMEEQLEEQNAKYNELFDAMTSIKEEKESLEREVAFAEVSESLTDTQAEKLSTLAEGLSFDSVDEFKQKLEAIKENYFSESVESATDETEMLEEEVEEEAAPAKILDESVAGYVSALDRLTGRK
jgi:hypothetical protein